LPDRINMVREIIRINSDAPLRPYLTGICNGDIVFSVWQEMNFRLQTLQAVSRRRLMRRPGFDPTIRVNNMYDPTSHNTYYVFNDDDDKTVMLYTEIITA
jgi:hypothetical protein